MNPKEKAEELTQKFMDLKTIKLSDYSRIEYPTAIQCALIAVEEIIDELCNVEFNLDLIFNITLFQYWTGVKQELLKM